MDGSSKRDATRQRLMEAANARFRTTGYTHATAAMIAEDAGVTERTFFRYFPTKAAVLLANWEGHAEALRAVLASSEKSNLVDVVRDALVAFTDRLQAEIDSGLDSVMRLYTNRASALAILQMLVDVETDVAIDLRETLVATGRRPRSAGRGERLPRHLPRLGTRLRHRSRQPTDLGDGHDAVATAAPHLRGAPECERGRPASAREVEGDPGGLEAVDERVRHLDDVGAGDEAERRARGGRAPRRRPGSRAGPATRRGRSGCRSRTRGGCSGRAVTSRRSGSAKCAGSRFADEYISTTCCPARIVSPPIS